MNRALDQHVLSGETPHCQDYEKEKETNVFTIPHGPNQTLVTLADGPSGARTAAVGRNVDCFAAIVRLICMGFEITVRRDTRAGATCHTKIVSMPIGRPAEVCRPAARRPA